MLEAVEETEVPDIARGDVLTETSLGFFRRGLPSGRHPRLPIVLAIGRERDVPAQHDIMDFMVFQIAGLGHDDHVFASSPTS
jgi:hypothetical protein